MNHVCFAAPPQQNSTYVLQLAEYILILFFRRHGSTRVRMYLVILQSNILVHTLFQVEVTTVTSVHLSEWNLTVQEAHSFSSLGYTKLKGEKQLFFKPF